MAAVLKLNVSFEFVAISMVSFVNHTKRNSRNTMSNPAMILFIALRRLAFSKEKKRAKICLLFLSNNFMSASVCPPEQFVSKRVKERVLFLSHNSDCVGCFTYFNFNAVVKAFAFAVDCYHKIF